MSKAIVITSIFKPTEAVNRFAAMKDYTLYVVGDKKTPADWQCDNVVFIPIEKQSQLGFHLFSDLPYNHYCRKMIGYLEAIKHGAHVIVDTDDDNIPKSSWAFPEFEAEFDTISPNQGFTNIYQYFTKMKIWPRGLPLSKINTKYLFEQMKMKNKIGVWQGLADEDPDVDAIYRLTSNEPCYFDEKMPVVLDIGTIAPFNTQNTSIVKELFPLLYLPTSVTFRYTDILRSFVAQPIMWLYGYRLGFTDATVVQKRNPHDYMKDFVSEIPMYESSEKAIESVESAISVSKDLLSNIHDAYEALLKNNIVNSKEFINLNAWLKDLSTLME